MMTKTVHTPLALRQKISAWRQAGERVALVPTMGALHKGHLALGQLARSHADRVVYSIFVNPKQFTPSEDFSIYPRREAEDLEKLGEAGVDLAYLPAAEVMYPKGFATQVRVEGLTECLCGPLRPGHFDGVATVVAKLLLQALPDVAVFGEKDYQQLLVIRRLVADLDIPVEIIGAPIQREADGLALSSRNHYLSADERAIAPVLYRTLTETAARLREAGKPDAKILEEAKQNILRAGFARMDYLEARDAATLALPDSFAAPARLFAAAFLGKTRLIDNVPIG